MKKLLFALALAAVLLPQRGAAQSTLVNVRATTYVVTVGTSSSQCVPASSQMTGLYVENTGGTNNVYVNFAPAAATSSDMLLAATGNGNKYWPPGTAPRGGLTCLAATSTSTVFVVVYTPQ